MSASPSAGEWGLFTFDKGALEDGFSARDPPRWLHVQVRAHGVQ
ncbi:MAG: hypothetical protein ACLQU1_27940 [Bryobacteraceae bacterium]